MASPLADAERLLGIKTKPLEALRGLSGLHIRERVSSIEALSSMMGQEVETANKYQIYADNSWFDDVFYAVETTSFLGRNLKMFCGDCAWWSVDVFYTQGLGSEYAFHLERQATCTCCCCNRPEVVVRDVQGNTIGSVRDPFPCCGGLTFSIRDPNDEKVLKMSSSCCPLGLWCPLPYGPCSEIEMDITDTDSGETVGRVTKKVPSTLKFLLSPDVDDYHVEFGRVSRPAHKALIMAMTIFMDFRWFNDNSRDQPTNIPRRIGGLLSEKDHRSCRSMRSCMRNCSLDGKE